MKERREQVRGVGRRLAPAWAASRARRYERARRQAAGLPELAQRVIDRVGDRVIDGPCTGLRYPADRLPDVDAPVAKLLATYERQLHEPLERAVDSGRSPFIDVGCADGYYAVGLALRHAELEVHAFDLARSARSLCADLAVSNGCADQIRVRGRCDTRQMAKLRLDNALVLADVEGAEFELFSEEMVSLLGGTVVIIELHRPVEDPACAALLERFLSSHGAQALAEHAPDPDAIPALSFLDPDERVAATSEWRAQSEQTWLVLTPR
jgi:hypothetical protein